MSAPKHHAESILAPFANRAATAYLESRARLRETQPAPEQILDSLQLLRVSDVCRLLRISKPTLWRLRRTSDFPQATELTERVIAWRKSDVESWLRSRPGGSRAASTPPTRA